jgi:hypothetical protein
VVADERVAAAVLGVTLVGGATGRATGNVASATAPPVVAKVGWPIDSAVSGDGTASAAAIERTAGCADMSSINNGFGSAYSWSVKSFAVRTCVTEQ